MLKGAEGEFADAPPRSYEGEVEPGFGRKDRSEAHALAQMRPTATLAEKDVLKGRSMLLTPKSLGALAVH